MSMNTCARSGGAALWVAAKLLWLGKPDHAARLESMQRDMDAIAAGPATSHRVHQAEVNDAWAEHARALSASRARCGGAAVIAGFVTVEQREALDRVRARAAVRVHECQDEPGPYGRPHGSRKSAETISPRGWRPALGRRRTRRLLVGDGRGDTAKIRRALRKAPVDGMTCSEIRALTKTGDPTSRLLAEMGDVEINRSDGRGRFR
jgi:sugar phosphate isomerase/epimerase